jgi:hypothetical protein
VSISPQFRFHCYQTPCHKLSTHTSRAYATNDDSKERKLLGQLWEYGGKGTALFLMAEKRDNDGRDVYQQLAQKIRTA